MQRQEQDIMQYFDPTTGVLDLSKDSDIFGDTVDRITEASLPKLCEIIHSNKDNLKTLILNNTRLGNNVMSLADALAKNHIIQNLDFSYCACTDQFIIKLSEALCRSNTVTSLNLRGNFQITLAGWKAITKISSLKILNVQMIKMDRDSVGVLTSITNIETLLVSRGRIYFGDQVKECHRILDENSPFERWKNAKNILLDSPPPSLKRLTAHTIKINSELKEYQSYKELPDDLNKLINMRKI